MENHSVKNRGEEREYIELALRRKPQILNQSLYSDDPGISPVGYGMVLITPRLWIQSPLWATDLRAGLDDPCGSLTI